MNAIARQTQYEYFASGDIKKIIKANGSTLSFVYDSARRLIEVVDNEGNKKKYEYDVASNVTSYDISKQQLTWVPGDPTCNPFLPPFPECKGGSWQMQDRVKYSMDYEYDSLDRLTASKKDFWQKEDFTYLKNGLIASAKDGYARSTSFNYDGNNKLEDTTFRNGGVSKITYDTNGNISGIRDALLQWTYYHRDGFGQAWQIVSPATGTTNYEYDAAGNLERKTDARGTVLNYAYDDLSRLKSIRVGTSTVPIQSVEYDTDRPGFLYQVTDEAGTHTFTRNQAGEILTKSSVLAGSTLALSYTYNVMGQVSVITYPSGLVVTYVYDSIGKVDKITAVGGGLSQSDVATSVDHYPWGPVSSFVYGNGESRSIILDGDYEDYKLLSGSHINRTFTSDYNGNITGFDSRLFTYDEMDQIETHSGPDGSYEYDYDLNGNRNWHKLNTVQTNYNYNSAKTRLNTLSGGNSESRYYDANGNTIQIGTRFFDHNDLNRFWRYREGTVTVTHIHNAFGERQIKQGGSTTTRFVYDGSSLLHESVNSTSRDYIYLGGEVVGLVKSGVLYYVHNDHIGRPEFVTNSAKTVVWNSENNAFRNTPGTDLIGNLNIGFPGQYYDIESGTHYNYFRTYDGNVGRYLQSDPIGLNGGLNSYVYVDANPILRIDPLGLQIAVPVPIPPPPGTTGTPQNQEAGRQLEELCITIFVNSTNLSLHVLNQVTGGDKEDGDENDQTRAEDLAGQTTPTPPDGGDDFDDGLKDGKPDIPTGSRQVRSDSARVKSPEFKQAVENRGLSTRGWTKKMETWQTPDGRMVERHYWVNKSGRAFHYGSGRGGGS